jgi:sugar phosphate isomerase/epimerase
MDSASYVSTNCFVDRTPPGILAAVRAAGWTRVECSAVRASHSEALDLCRELRAEGVEVLLHNYFPPPDELFVMNLAACDTDVLRKSRAHCELAMRLSAELGATIFAAHAGFGLDVPPALLGDPAGQRRFCAENRNRFSPNEARKIFAESVKLLIEFGKQVGVQFLIENHVAGAELGESDAHMLLLCLGAEEIQELAREVGEEDFGLLLDAGHLNCTAKTLGFSREDYCRSVSPWVKAFHLSENNGSYDAHRPFGPGAWFLEEVSLHPEATITLEFERCSEADIRAAMRALKNR